MKGFKTIIYFVLLLSSTVSFGQNNAENVIGNYIDGTVKDSALGAPIPQAFVRLHAFGSDSLIQETYTDSTGKFSFSLAQKGLFYISAQVSSYFQKQSSQIQFDSIAGITIHLPPFDLLPITQSLKEAEIRAEKPLIENKVDKLVYNASLDISSKGGSATDLLRKVPMVEVDLDGNVSIRGSQSIRVLINGKQSGIVSASIKDALRTIPADEIESVEVITNPSAKYDAEGTAGIINIVLKNSKLKGTSGNLHSGAGNRSGNLGLSISRQQGKNALSFRLGGFYWRNVGSGVMDRSNQRDSITYKLLQNSENRTFGAGPRFSVGLDHTFSKFQSISLAATIRGNLNSNKSDWETKTGSDLVPLSLQYGRNTRNLGVTLGYDLSADYHRTYKKPGREWNVSLLYNGNSQSTDYDATQTNSSKIENYKEKSSNLGLNNEVTFQTDFVEPVSKKLIVEAGIKGIARKVTSSYYFDSFNFGNNEYGRINTRSNDFFYNQSVFGGYTQGTWQFAKNYSVRIGGRYEYTMFGGGRKDSALDFTGKPYGNFIPFFSLNRVFGYTGFLRFNYTQRLLRPSLFYLNPYTNFSDPRNLSTGNPYLRAEVSNNFELSAGNYTKKGGGSITGYYRKTNNTIESIRNVDSAGIYQTTYGNVGLNTITGADVNLNFKGKLWMLNFNGGLGYVQIKSLQKTGSVAGLSNAGLTYSAGLFGYYKFTKQWSAEAFARINAPTYSLQGRTQNWYFHTIGIKRRFKNDAGGIGLGIDNPFTPHITYTTKQTGTDFQFSDIREINMLGIRLNFDYKFGKVEVEQSQKPKKGIKNDDLKPGGNDQGGQSGS